LPIFLLLFFLVPLVELYILIQVGQGIGALNTVALCVLTAVLGAALLRQQGFRTLYRARQNLDRGSVPALELLEAVALAMGGVLLLTPGFATDAFGFVCLIPFTRRFLVNGLLARMQVVVRPGEQPQPPANDAGGNRRDAIEGEYERRDRN